MKAHVKVQKTDSPMRIITSTSWLEYEEVLDAGQAVVGRANS
jgi:tetrahydromethanopterin S-methyltransferase subunit A